MANGARLLVDGLRAVGVDVAFGLPGTHNMPLWPASTAAGLRIVGVRHEQTAAYAADGYARATGRLGVALTTTGPGAANAVAATGEAWASGTPLLVVSTDVPLAERRQGSYRGLLHETIDQAGFFRPVTKATLRVEKPDEVFAAVQLAAFHAFDAPSRPVYLEIPTDVLTTEAGPERLEAEIADDRTRVADAGDIVAAAALLAGAERPLIWAGGGALRGQAGPEVAMLAERLGAPVIETYGARGLIGDDHPLAMGLAPHLPEVGARWDAADVVVAVGSDFDAMSTQGWRQPAPAALISVNIDRDDGAKAYTPDVALTGDAALSLAALLGEVPESGRFDGAVEEVAGIREAARTALRGAYPEEMAFLDAFAGALPPEAVVVADMCIPGYWLGAGHRLAGPRRLQYPVGWGTLGYAFPASLGAAAAGTGPVVSVCGDGGFLFACGELAAAVQEGLAVTVVVVDDGGYGMLRDVQGPEPLGTELVTPDFVALARSFGVDAEAVDGLDEDFGAALAKHVARDEPTLLCARARLMPPPTTTLHWPRPPRPPGPTA